MALTIGEAHDLNTLLLWAMGKDREHGGLASVISDESATEAARNLAGKAFKTLAAGLRPGDVTLDRRTTMESFDGELAGPPFDENHHRFHTPNQPVASCATCVYRGWAER